MEISLHEDLTHEIVLICCERSRSTIRAFIRLYLCCRTGEFVDEPFKEPREKYDIGLPLYG